jgi:altronate dehydratase small subunit
MELKEKAVVLNARDNVATALANLEAGSTLELEIDGKRVDVILKAPIPFGHKFSIADIPEGAAVIKYGEAIGVATSAISPGDYVHVHNLASTRGSAARGGAR